MEHRQTPIFFVPRSSPEVIPVWADFGYLYMGNDGEVKSGQGAYIHVAIYNGKANHFSELTPVN